MKDAILGISCMSASSDTLHLFDCSEHSSVFGEVIQVKLLSFFFIPFFLCKNVGVQKLSYDFESKGFFAFLIQIGSYLTVL